MLMQLGQHDYERGAERRGFGWPVGVNIALSLGLGLMWGIAGGRDALPWPNAVIVVTATGVVAGVIAVGVVELRQRFRAMRRRIEELEAERAWVRQVETSRGGPDR